MDRRDLYRKIRNQSDELFKFVIELISDMHENDDLTAIESSERKIIPNGSFKTTGFRSKSSDYEFKFETTELKIDGVDHTWYDVNVFNEFGSRVLSFTSYDPLTFSTLKLDDLFKIYNDIK